MYAIPFRHQCPPPPAILVSPKQGPTTTSINRAPKAMSEIMPAIIKGADLSQEEFLRMEREAVRNTLGGAESQEGIRNDGFF